MTPPAGRDSSPPLAVPGGRVLAGWWRQLSQDAPRPVRALWFAHLLLHRVESLFEVLSPSPFDPVARLILHALALSPSRGVADLDSSFHLGPGLLARLLGGLESAGLARRVDAASWTLTDAGRDFVGRDSATRTERRRRTLHFVEDRPEGDRPAGPPHFLNVSLNGASSWPADEGWTFDPALVEQCLRQPDAWKQRHNFPGDLRGLVGFRPDEWRSVVLDRPEHLATLLVLSGDGGGTLTGYAVRPDGWVLQTAQPAFSLTDGWDAVFPDLGREPPAEAWLQAWRVWCQSRALPAAEVEACAVRPQGSVVRVEAPAKLVERLKAARGDVLKGEAWLTAGAGPIRPVAQVELAEGATPS